ncbi:hypothetical protein DPEC_G00197340 [Dallia pectoralis]|uniref:Uncharacterized protein n=1 Tax=Dallia pectoralis TaxID=75939 RepID=A0ACC2G885_DALPE|nr:hypothetical protein DPEC_G00197340 [Dallia pectoralis]
MCFSPSHYPSNSRACPQHTTDYCLLIPINCPDSCRSSLTLIGTEAPSCKQPIRGVEGREGLRVAQSR